MDGVALLGLDRATFVDWITNDIHDPAQSLRTDGDTDGCAGVDDFLPTDETFSRIHGDGAHSGVSEMLCDFEDESVLDSFHFECVEDGRDFSFELDVDDGSDHLPQMGRTWEICPFFRAAALAPEKRLRAV